MKRMLPAAIVVVIGVALVATLAFLGMKARQEPVEYRTVSPEVADIVKKTVATGSIVPRHEVAIKSQVSGIVDQLAVEPGDEVGKGDLIAKIRIVPDNQALTQAEAAVASARINRDDAKASYERTRALFEQRAVSATELEGDRVAYELRKQEYSAAVDNLQLVREGASRRRGLVSTEVRSTVAGMVLSVDVEEGQSVIESNTFNEGTTIANVANMGDLVFEGSLDESEVGKARVGMPIKMVVAALEGRAFNGELEYISPKGVLTDGAVQFEIRAAVQTGDDTFIRAGSSANADLVLARKEQVLTVPESALVFEGDKVFVEVQRAPQQFERREIEVGISDGLKIEVLSGVEPSDQLKNGEA